MSALWITTRPKSMDREPAHLWSKLDYTDVSSTRDTVTTLLPLRRSCIECEDRTIKSVYTSNRQTGSGIIELFSLAFIDTLQSSNFTPRNFPRPKTLLEHSH